MKILKLLLIMLGLFLVSFVVCAFFHLGYIVSAIFSVIISLCVTYLFFNKQRKEGNEQLASLLRGNKNKSSTANKTVGELQDNDYEDSILDQEEKDSQKVTSRSVSKKDSSAAHSTEVKVSESADHDREKN